MVESANLLLLGKHRLLCECLIAELNQLDPFHVVGSYDDSREAEAQIRAQTPDVLLVDAGAGQELDLEWVRGIARKFPSIKIVVFGLSEVEAEILSCFEAGVRGCVVKEASLEQLKMTLEKVLAGETECSPKVMCLLLSRLSDLATERRSCERVAAFDLTPRELETLTLIAEGLSNRQIADRLCLSLFTVKNHVHHILEKLEVKDRLEAVEKAFENGWLEDQRMRRRIAGQRMGPRG